MYLIQQISINLPQITAEEPKLGSTGANTRLVFWTISVTASVVCCSGCLVASAVDNSWCVEVYSISATTGSSGQSESKVAAILLSKK